jgi:FkbM family methyltransferase
MGIISALKNIVNKKITIPKENKRGLFTYQKHLVYFPKNSFLFKRVKGGEKLYERELVKIINRQLKDGSFYFDIGANIGLLAIPFLNYNKSVSVVSFEPSPNTYKYLAKTVADSCYKNRWTAINKAIGDKEGKLQLHLADESMGAFDSFKDTKRVPYVNIVDVEVTTIDKAWIEIGRPPVCVIKIDTEGADLPGLMGGKECIKATHPFISLEWNRRNVDAFGITPQQLIDFCKEINYGMFGFPYMQRIETENEIRVFSDASDTIILIPR